MQAKKIIAHENPLAYVPREETKWMVLEKQDGPLPAWRRRHFCLEEGVSVQKDRMTYLGPLLFDKFLVSVRTSEESLIYLMPDLFAELEPAFAQPLIPIQVVNSTHKHHE